MAEEWANIEENPLVIDAETDDDSECLDKGINDDDNNEDGDDDNDTNGSENNNQMDTDTGMERDIVMIAATVQKKPKLSLNEAEDKLKEVCEYISASGAPADTDNIDLLIPCVNNLRAHNASKAQQQQNITRFFASIEKK